MLELMKFKGEFAFSQDAFDDVVKYFGENPKTTPPSVFFPVFVRFVKAYKVSGSRALPGPPCVAFPSGGPHSGLPSQRLCRGLASPYE